MITEKGFYPALGTPLDENGKLIKDSFVRQINAMIDAGARGVLCMGSMGAEAALDLQTYAETAKVAAETVNGRVPLFIGAMDNSIFKIRERVETLKGLQFDGVVLTTPFYSTTSAANLIRFFNEAAAISPKPVYLYDLPGVTKQKITYEMVVELQKNPNIKGIKSGDIVLGRQVHLNFPEFEFLFSNLDIFDVGLTFGLPAVLDGMFTCTPVNSKLFAEAVSKENWREAGIYLDRILSLRNAFLPSGVWPAYTVCMNLLGFTGNYGFGYEAPPSDTEVAQMKALMKEIGEL